MRLFGICFSALLTTLVLVGCASSSPTLSRPTRPAGVTAINRPMLGIDVLEANGFAALRGKRVGLLSHPAGVNRLGVPTVDVLRRDPRVNLVALFAVEHGFYGEYTAGEHFEDQRDPRTGLPVYSLYSGRTRSATPEQLSQIDVLVIDLQDIGTRSYTFVSAMLYQMEACFQNQVEVVVLDRPNPLGGLKVSGPIIDPEWIGYLGAAAVPYVHGLTIGEFARMAAGESGILRVSDAVRRQGRLTVVPMQGWRRSQTWPDTGLTWVPTSPNIPSFAAVVGYPMTGLGAQLGGFRHGIGTPYPFRLLTHPSIPPAQLAATLNARRIPGLTFTVLTTNDSQGRPVTGVYVGVTDWSAWRPTELNFVMMQLAASVTSPNPFAAASADEAELFNKHTGSNAWWSALKRDGARVDVAGFFNSWETAARAFQQRTRRWWLYQP